LAASIKASAKAKA